MTREEAALKHFEMLARALEAGNYYDDLDEIDDYINIKDLYVAIEALQERPKGRWKRNEHDKIVCSNCKNEPLLNDFGFWSMSNFCPNCGRDNRGDEE